MIHFFDLLVGLIAAFLAWGIYHWTGQPIWSLLFLLFITALVLWIMPQWRTKGRTKGRPKSETQDRGPEQTALPAKEPQTALDNIKDDDAERK